MPYKSRAQAAYFNIHKKKLERQGVNVSEWNSASKGMTLPQYAIQKERIHMTKKKKWIGSSIRHPGALKAAAGRAGKSTREFAEEHKGSSGKIGKRARLAITLMGMHHK